LRFPTPSYPKPLLKEEKKESSGSSAELAVTLAGKSLPAMNRRGTEQDEDKDDQPQTTYSNDEDYDKSDVDYR